MFSTLAQFYNSEIWRTFRLSLILERTAADGFLYSEYSGKPILNSYEIVAHHKIELTPENVNDFSISLNPENVMLVSIAEHNEIHKRFGFSAYRKVYLVYGAPCSGKTTFVNSVRGLSDIVLDMDAIWFMLTGRPYEKPAALRTNVFAIRDLIFEQIRTRTGRWERAWVIDGGARKPDRERKSALLGAEEIYINTDRLTCLKRLSRDDTRTESQKNEWTAYINEWFEEYTE